MALVKVTAVLMATAAAITLNPSANKDPGLANCANDYYPNAYNLNKIYIDIAVVNGRSVKIYSNSSTSSSSTLGTTNFGPGSNTVYVGAISTGIASRIFNGYCL